MVPADGKKISVSADGALNVTDNPIIPFIEGDGTGVGITPVMINVIDAAVAKAYGGSEIVIKYVIADAFLQQTLLRPAEYSLSPRSI